MNKLYVTLTVLQICRSSKIYFCRVKLMICDSKFKLTKYTFCPIFLCIYLATSLSSKVSCTIYLSKTTVHAYLGGIKKCSAEIPMQMQQNTFFDMACCIQGLHRFCKDLNL